MVNEAKVHNFSMINGAASGRIVPRAAASSAALFLVCALLAAALSLIQPGASNIAGPVLVFPGPSISARKPILLDGNRPDWRQVRPGNSLAWLSGRWTPPPAGDGAVAFRMSGLFSAELYWNGRMIGRKGVPGESPGTEVPGPIDSAILIPERLIRGGGNAWALKVSSQNAGYETPSAIQEIQIGPYRGAARGMDYYLPALLLFGGIAACGALAVGRYAQKRELRSGAVAASAVLLAGALAAEVSRAAVNYAYDWHIYRQAGTLILLSSHIALIVVALAAGISQSRLLAWLFPAAAAAGALLAVVLVAGFDQKIAWVLGLGYAASLALDQVRRRSSGPSPLGIIALCGLVFAAINRPDFLNAGVYAVGLALLGAMLKRDGNSRGHEAVISDPAGLLVCGAGEERMIAWTDIATLRAFGNSTELKLRSGAAFEDRRGLGRLLRLAPSGFLRVHKSFAVNIECMIGLETVRRGCYRLLLSDGRRIPLSRAMRTAVRDAIKTRAEGSPKLHSAAGLP